ncbi:hypothetical protein AAMO2058_000456600 [Amorphochlora amoebiformis]|uniref:Nucleolar protein 58 n=1 Tax=Amorphochlora amoebiformis TaxID=1561963 RepID=A0A7S0H0U9_9EUKA|mmetsp:Transcript_22684/g.35628  ORF Transcript_22684/g.35628 Transcript_22684/m.35628 type:complete len:501 (+) Transcript_22684:120-1622(+)
MLVLFEAAAGYALFKVMDKGVLKDATNLRKAFQSPATAAQTIKLKAFKKFKDTTSALKAAAAIREGKLDKALEKFLTKKNPKKLKVAVMDKKLGSLIKDKMQISCAHNDLVIGLMRGIRQHMDSLLSLDENEKRAFQLGLSHSLARFQLKFSPDKVDTMIIQAIALLDELDKELNTYAMRVREWYGWHFPEVLKILSDNLMFAKMVKAVGSRTNAKSTDLSDILPEEVEKEVKEAAEISMGSEIAQEDMDNISELCDQVIYLTDYRSQLFDYLKNRMNAIAPNLSFMVGELVGARLIAHAGSLISLAKSPASTVQILGAEKALFRALKTKHETPKYGLIYHASLVGQAAPKHKGKISRMLAAKTALATRTDALGESEGVTVGIQGREKVEERLRQLEGGVLRSVSGSGKAQVNQKRHLPTGGAMYNSASDVTSSKTKKRSREESDKSESKMNVESKNEQKDEDEPPKKKKKVKKAKKEKKEKASNGTEKKKKKKKRKKED